MEYPNIDFDSNRREREKVEKQIHALWRKWDKQGGPTDEYKASILKSLHPRRDTREYVMPIDTVVCVEAEALIGYKYKDMNIFEFLTHCD